MQQGGAASERRHDEDRPPRDGRFPKAPALDQGLDQRRLQKLLAREGEARRLPLEVVAQDVQPFLRQRIERQRPRPRPGRVDHATGGEHPLPVTGQKAAEVAHVPGPAPAT